MHDFIPTKLENICTSLGTRYSTCVLSERNNVRLSNVLNQRIFLIWKEKLSAFTNMKYVT